MSQDEIFEQVVKILTPYVKNQEALDTVGLTTHILDELKVNSARLVDVVLEFEDAFDIEIADEDVDSVETVGNAVELIASKRSPRSSRCRRRRSCSGADREYCVGRTRRRWRVCAWRPRAARGDHKLWLCRSRYTWSSLQ